MTRTQTRTYGVVTPSSRQPLLEAMLCAFAWLVSNLGSMFGRTYRFSARDWHTRTTSEAPPHPPTAQPTKEVHLSQPSFSALCRDSRLHNTRGTAPYSHATSNRDARHKAEHDTVGVTASLSLSFRAKAHCAEDLGERRRLGAIWSGRPNRGANAEGPRSDKLALSPLMPMNVDIQGRPRTLSCLAAPSLHPQQNRSWIPTFVGMSGSFC